MAKLDMNYCYDNHYSTTSKRRWFYDKEPKLICMYLEIM